MSLFAYTKPQKLSLLLLTQGGHNRVPRVDAATFKTRTAAVMVGAITGMIRGKWSGWYGIVEQALCGWRVWAAALGGRPNR